MLNQLIKYIKWSVVHNTFVINKSSMIAVNHFTDNTTENS